MRRIKGLTLIELMAAMAILGIMAVSLAGAWAAATRYRSQSGESRIAHDRVIQFENKITSLIRAAYLSPQQTDDTTYFVSLDEDTASSEPAPGIVFTTSGIRVPGVYLVTDESLESLNEQFGPQGGLAEVSLSLVAIGESQGQTGLFLREQRPSDGDYEQGGFESVFEPDLETIGFEFFDGLAWVNYWSTFEEERRLPAVVRVTYRLTDDEDRVLVVPIPASDVTPANPIGAEEAAQ